jgi:hypothetical protein
MWLYRSPIGNIYIVPLPNGRFGMLYNDIIWESCHSPQSEADNIYMQCTGCSDWDMYDTSNTIVPSELSQWEKV